jgi:TRAP-type transport system periplasmic protein
MALKRFLAGACLAMALAISSAPLHAKTFELSVFFSEKDNFGDVMRWWTEQVAKRTEGRVEIKPVYNGALVKVTETLDAVRDGVIPMGAGLSSLMSGTIPALAYTELVGAFPAGDPEKTGKAFEAVWPTYVNALQSQGVVPLWGESAFGTGVICRRNFVTSPTDWKGLTVRATGRWMSRQVEAMGAKAVTIDPGELYIALQSGTVDCALMNSAITASLKLFEVAPYYTNFALASNILTFLVNKSVWDSFSAADRAAIQELSKKAMMRGMVHLFGKTKEQFDIIKAGGGKVHEVDAGEREAFLKASRPIFDEIGKVSGPLGQEFDKHLSAYR